MSMSIAELALLKELEARVAALELRLASCEAPEAAPPAAPATKNKPTK